MMMLTSPWRFFGYTYYEETPGKTHLYYGIMYPLSRRSWSVCWGRWMSISFLLWPDGWMDRWLGFSAFGQQMEQFHQNWMGHFCILTLNFIQTLLCHLVLHRYFTFLWKEGKTFFYNYSKDILKNYFYKIVLLFAWTGHSAEAWSGKLNQLLPHQTSPEDHEVPTTAEGTSRTNNHYTVTNNFTFLFIQTK